MKNKLVVVTGGAGFIGSHIAEALVEENEVIVIDNLYSGKIENIPQGAKFIEADIRDYSSIAEIIREADYVFHEAAQISVEESVRDPIFTDEVNVIGTLNILKALSEGSGKIIFASSAAVYGENKNLPLKEDYLPKPISPYGVSKLAGEHYVRVFYELYGVPGVILRYFNVYGPRQSSAYAGVISIFMKNALKNEPLVIFGDGKQTRDFIYVKDVVQANLLVAEKERANGKIFNVATGKETSILELALKIIDLTSSSSQILFAPERPGDIKRSVADINEIRKLGFEPSYSLEEGLKETLEWFKKWKYF
ncbi:nucleoside-diphosphate sugar epimerase [Pyrococcus furiosus DSM 3638]|uniref:Nucleoside-diphosphate sugar epimerase n=3 Tax=Pyrococcus furiosus TaxID=2261 RepID=A0A5C0XX59_PYRFU|nr:SDR family oxidoreductase [Pyrococcus furiosus]AAL81912.1 NDP-sugar dehydratase or epimerase [Pyrococcus furiosus DSM 3638]AFN04853.1 NDP-sugar dehydratase or epimerase [Pyrococcus furiosus COM1]QEK79390.1 nucleoside-diphosphate sugar epimerase [Pyrococcus furiosus DSM 3638]